MENVSNSVIFTQYKDQIQKAIQGKIIAGAISDPQGFVLVDGFINIPLQNEIGGAFVIGGQSIPGVMVVGKSTGVVHTFALKVLLPNIPL